ncbi:MAG: hypothetical protein AAF517_18875 [Planctomycetota bacterium]
MSGAVSANRFLPALLLGLSIVGVGCSGPRVREEKNDEGYSISIGPIDVSALVNLHIDAKLVAANLPAPEDVAVTFHFRYKDFQQVTALADGRPFKAPRQSFGENRARYSLEKFRAIGRARKLEFLFDREVERFPIAKDQLRKLQHFVTKLDFQYESYRAGRP